MGRLQIQRFIPMTCIMLPGLCSNFLQYKIVLKHCSKSKKSSTCCVTAPYLKKNKTLLHKSIKLGDISKETTTCMCYNLLSVIVIVKQSVHIQRHPVQ